jgi:hypothetical protein
MQAGNKMQVPKEASRYHQVEFSLRVVATQIPKPRQPNTYFLSSLFKSRGRDFFKGGSLSRPKILPNFGGIFLFLFCLCWLKIRRDLKLFEFIWKLCLKTTLNPLFISWRTSLRKIKYQNTIFHPLFKPMQACLQRSESQMCSI